MPSSTALVNSILHGYPEPVGNKHHLVVNFNGPDEYSVGGCPMEIPRGVKWIEFAHFSAMIDPTDSDHLYFIHPVFTTDVKGSNSLTLIIVDNDTGVEAVGDPDLSGATFRADIIGRI